MSRARLFSKWGPTRDLDFAIDETATIGRAADSTVRLDHRSVSSNHARLEFDAERDAYYVEDLDSLNGTRVDGVRVRGRERLERLHLLDFGGSSPFLFVRAETPAAGPTPPERASAPAETSAPERTSVDREIPVVPEALAEPAAAPDAGKTSIEELAVVLPDLPESVDEPARREPALRFAGGRELTLPEGEVVVGRAPDAGVRIDAAEISRHHARLRRDGDKVFLTDLGSHNRTFVEEYRLEPGKEVELTPPANLRFGTIQAQLVVVVESRG